MNYLHTKNYFVMTRKNFNKLRAKDYNTSNTDYWIKQFGFIF